MNKILTTILLGLFLFSFVSAENIGNFRVNESFQITNYCATSDCSYMNITSITSPSGQVVYYNEEMTKNEQEFNYTYTPLELGIYNFKTCADPESTVRCESDEFTVSPTGKELTYSKSILYTIIIVMSLLVFLGLLWVGILLPSKNKSDEMTGYILAVNNLKYLKHFLLGFAYITLVWISYFLWMITYAYLDFNFLTTIFRFIFTFLAIVTLPLFILYVYLTITNFIKDQQIGDFLMRGLNVR